MNKILVIIPIYNREKYLKKAIDSVLNQTHKNFELRGIMPSTTSKIPSGTFLQFTTLTTLRVLIGFKKSYYPSQIKIF